MSQEPEHNDLEAQAAALALADARLGQREREVLDLVWKTGSATVQQVVDQLREAPAYTTVMTTLDRLYKKRLLLREKRDRAFVYSPAISKDELEYGRASAMMHGFFSRSAMSNDTVLSCLVDVVQSYDGALLSRLEEKIRRAKLETAEAEDRRNGAA
jgi:predicted transcriptional regulator